MSFYDLVDRNRQAWEEEDKVEETTTMGDISFIPAQVGVVRSAILKLKKKKNKWNLEILENGEGKTVQFENELAIHVPFEHWEDFQSIFDKDLTENTYLDLQLLLQDKVQMKEEVVFETRREELKHKIEEQLNNKEIILAAKIVDKFFSEFECKEDLTSFMESIVIPLRNSDQWANNKYAELLQEHEDDLGYLEILVENWNAEPGNYLAGGRYLLSCNGSGMILEVRVNPGKSPSFSLKINDGEIADDLDEAFVNLPRIGNIFYPVVDQVDDVISILKEIIADSEE